MENAIRVFLVDSSRDHLDMLCHSLAQQEDFIVAGTAVSGDRAAEAFPASNADLLVTELLLPGLDGMSLLRHLETQGCLRHAIVVSSFFNERIAKAVSHLADYYLTKPYRMENLISHMREAVRGHGHKLVYNYTAVVTQLLLDFGMPTHLDGFNYLRDSILRILDDRTLLRGVTKALYRETAKRFGTTPLCVERSIRTAIVAGWARQSKEERSKRFGSLFDSFKKAPSNVPFLTAMIEFMEVQYEREQQDQDYRLLR